MDSSSIKLLNISLIESAFKRSNEIHYEDPNFKNEISINLENHKKQQKLFITFTLDFYSKFNEVAEIEAKIKMVGLFEYSDPLSIPIDDFAKINGPAIIFPFIREHLASLSIKAGLNPILLPPMNFVNLAMKKD